MVAENEPVEPQITILNLILNTIKLFSKRFGVIYLLKTIFSLIKARKLSPIDASNARFATSIAATSTVYPLLKQNLIGRLQPMHIPFVAGSLSSLLLRIDTDSTRTGTISQIIFVRTAFYLIRAFTYSNPGGRFFIGDREKKLSIRNSNSRVIIAIRKIIDMNGGHIIWIIFAYIIVFTTFNYPNYVSKSYFKGLVYISGCYKKYGKMAESMVYNSGMLLQNLHAKRHLQALERIPESKTSIDYLTQTKDSIKDPLIKADFLKIMVFTDFIPPSIHHDYLQCVFSHPHHSSCLKGALFTAKKVLLSGGKTYLILNSVIPYLK